MTRFYIDTNVFLDFYQAAKDRLVVFHELALRAGNIVLTEQTAREFRRNRASRLMDLSEKVEKSAVANIYTTAIVQDMAEFAGWVKARDDAKRQAKVIANKLKAWAVDEVSDPVYLEFNKLSAAAALLATTAEAIEKAKTRKALGEPPTSPDKHTIGDELIWETLLAQCKEHLIIVSRDRTFLDNMSLLKAEYEVGGDRRLLAITESLQEALALVGQPSEEISKAEKRLREEADAELAINTGRCPKCTCELDEQGYEGSEGDEAWWLHCPKCGRDFFPPS